MRNIFALISRSYVFLMFLAMQVLALYILFASNNYHQSEFMQQSNDLVGSIYAKRAQLAEYIYLGSLNDKLTLENAQLRSQRSENFYIQRTSSDTLTDTLAQQRYVYRPARVVNYSVNREQNYIYLTLDRGITGDVKEKMGVIAHGALVGKVVSVSDHFAVVMPILHKDFSTSVKHKNSGFMGYIVWRGGDPAIADVIQITRSVPVNIGDTILTTGNSSFFPRNLMVGVVERIEEDKDFHLLKVRLAADFGRIDYVEVISDLMHEEQQTLEQQVENATGDTD
ncbi:MAG: rod shape-determining protein MreC [Flavobacteriales bacterium]